MERLNCSLTSRSILSSHLIDRSSIAVTLKAILEERHPIEVLLTPIPIISSKMAGIPTIVVSLETVDSMVKTETLTVNKNGTYIPPAGVGYNKVIVDVPVPNNYGLITYNGVYLMVS